MATNFYGGGTPDTTKDNYWNGDIPWIQSSDLAEHQVSIVTPRKFISRVGLSKSAAKIVPENSVAVVTRVGVGKLVLMSFPYATSQDFLSLSELKIDKWFVVYMLYKRLRDDKNSLQGTSIKGITKNELLAKKIIIPKASKEQSEIGNFFKQLDETITLHQRKLELLKRMKQGYLQRMFPQKDEKVPKVRFDGCDGEWKQKWLGKIGQTQSGIGFPDTEQGGVEGVPFYKVSDMSNIGNEIEMIRANNYVSGKQIESRKWKPIKEVPSLIFAKVGAALMLNRKRLVHMPFLIDNNMMAYIFSDSWDVNFGKTLFETINLPRYAQIGALPSYNKSDIESILVNIASLKEQSKIGCFFKQLDEDILLYQTKLEKLQILKKSYLQLMFI